MSEAAWAEIHNRVGEFYRERRLMPTVNQRLADLEERLRLLEEKRKRGRPRKLVDHARVLELVRQGKRVDEISSEVQSSKDYVYKTIRKNLGWEEATQLRKSRLRCPRPRSDQLIERDGKMTEMRLAGKTLESIGQAFGVTRERVRQRMGKLGVPKPPKPAKPPKPLGKGVLTGILIAGGFRKCYGLCKQWKPKSEFSSKSNRCRECNSEYQAHQWKEDPEKMKAQARARYHRNIEKMREYNRAWASKRAAERKAV